METTHARARLAMMVLIVAVATVGAACSPPPSGHKMPPPPWLAAGCYSSPGAPGVTPKQDISFNGTPNQALNVSIDGSTDGTCDPNPALPGRADATLVRASSQVDADTACDDLNENTIANLASSLASNGYNVPSDAWLCSKRTPPPPDPWTAAINSCWLPNGNGSHYALEYLGPVDTHYNAISFISGIGCNDANYARTVVEASDLLQAEGKCSILEGLASAEQVSLDFTGPNIPTDAWLCE
jgi:hypothetical protein